MKTLQPVLKRDGFTLEQIERTGPLAIYRQTKPGQSWERFEVVKIRHAKAKIMPNGLTVPAREVYPSSADWGKSGWTCISLEQARAKMAAIGGQVAPQAFSAPGKVTTADCSPEPY